jgi:hypothetical protein
MSQVIHKETLSSSGGNVNNGSIKGGFTLGEVGVKTTIALVKYFEGYNFIKKDNPYPGCLNVTIAGPEGDGSFRAAIECAQEYDIITIDPQLSNQSLLLDLPSIFINNDISILNNGTNVTLRNLNPVNTAPLIYFNSDITINDLDLLGINGGLILRIIAPNMVIWK